MLAAVNLTYGSPVLRDDADGPNPVDANMMRNGTQSILSVRKLANAAARVLAMVGLTFALGLPQGNAKASDRVSFISIGTGGVTGVYYPAGGAICRLMNRHRKTTQIRCSSESTAGSIANIKGLRRGDLSFGIVQSDVQYHAYRGDGGFAGDKPFGDMRAVFTLYPEAVTVVARDDAKIKQLDDLKGKRVSIGNPDSGMFATWQTLEKAWGWNQASVQRVTDYRSSDLTQAICADRIEAYFWLVGHPSASTKETIGACPTHLVPVEGPNVTQLIDEQPYFSQTQIAAGMYNNASPISTIAVSATLVTRADIDEEIVYQLVKSVFDDLARFKRLHPAFAELDVEQMLTRARTAPLHVGAIRYYKERSWM